MMVLLTAVPRLLVGAITKLTKKQAEAVFWVWYYGILKGYSWSNIEWITQQMVLETGWGGSPLLEKNNNAFGMSCTNSVNTTQVGCTQLQDGNTNGNYKSVQSSVKDRFLWDEKRFTEPYAARKEANYGEMVSERFYPSNPVVYDATIRSVDNGPMRLAIAVFTVFVPLELLIVSKLIK